MLLREELSTIHFLFFHARHIVPVMIKDGEIDGQTLIFLYRKKKKNTDDWSTLKRKRKLMKRVLDAEERLG